MSSKLDRESIRSMTSKQLEEEVNNAERSMTNYERSQYCRKLKAEGKLKKLYREVK